MKKALFATFATLFIVAKSFGQNDLSLFTVNGKPVTVGEFKYIYAKTNGTKADFSRASVNEYLDLYTKFKQKVARARDMKLDTIPSLQEELDGYRRQLADSYLTDREVTDKLIKEAHDRLLKDVSIKHILVAIKSPDTVNAYSKILGISNSLAKGAKFEELAKVDSEDPNTKERGGEIGFLTAMLPEGFYALESAIYQTPVGGVSPIVRSPLGYHIIKVSAERPARGEIEVAHILVRKMKDGQAQLDAKQRIDNIYRQLSGGSKFEDLAQSSEDQNSAPRGGYLGFFGIGQFELVFEDAAFALAKDGDFTQPIESSIGWHVIKRVSARPIAPLDAQKSRLKAKIVADSRHEAAKIAMVERIKRDGQFMEKPMAKANYIALLDSSFLTYSWKKPTTMVPVPIMSFGTEKTYSTGDFDAWLEENANRRINYALTFGNRVPDVANQCFKDFVNEKALGYEETQLEKKYPDFKNLMREYEEGILLFEAIKQNVWDKASVDTIGLEKFFKNNRAKYQWEERASFINYAVSDTLKGEIEAIKKFAANNLPQKVLAKFNKKGEYVSFVEETKEKSKAKLAADTQWKKGSIYTPNANGPLNFTKIEKIIPAGPKELKEARGFAVADYQEFLEKQWVEELAKAYPVKIDSKVLDSIVK